MKNNIVRINEEDYIDVTDKITFDFSGDAGEGVINDSLRQLYKEQRKKRAKKIARKKAIIAGIASFFICCAITVMALYACGIRDEIADASITFSAIMALAITYFVGAHNSH